MLALHLAVGTEEALALLGAHAATGIADRNLHKHLSTLHSPFFALHPHAAFGGVLQGVGHQVAQQDGRQQSVAPHMQLRGLEPQLHTGPRTHHLATHLVQHLLQREHRRAERQSRGDGQVGPILDIVEGAQQLLQHLTPQFGAEVGAAQVADEGAHIVAHHAEAGLHVGNALHVAPLGGLELPLLAPQAQGVAPQEHRQHQQQQGQHPEDHGRVGHPAAAACGGGQRLLQHKVLLLALLDVVLQLRVVLIPAPVLVGVLGYAAAYQHVEVAQLHLRSRKGLPRAPQRAPLVQHLVGTQRVADQQRIARCRDSAAQHLVGVAIVEKDLAGSIVERQHTVGRHRPREALQRRRHHL